MTDHEPMGFCYSADLGCVDAVRPCQGIETYTQEAPHVITTDTGERVLADRALTLVGVRCRRFPDRIEPLSPSKSTQDRKEG